MPEGAALGVGQVVWGALAQGVLTGKYRDGRAPEGSRGADSFRSQFMEEFLKTAVLERVEALGELAGDVGMTRAQVALAWCLRSPRVASVIVGATRTEQLDDNVRALAKPLPESALSRLDALFPPGLLDVPPDS